LYGVGTWTLRQVDKKYSGSFEMWCWKKMEISLTDRVKNEEVNEIKDVRNILYTQERKES
jgi:hypothetical protein